MKKIIVLAVALICIMGLVGCGRTMNDIIENEPNVTGVVEEVHDNYIVMYSETADGYPNGTRWSISLNVENKDSYTDIVVGDEIVVYYDGMAAETDPLEVNTVYAITLKTPADRLLDIERTEEPDEYPPTNIVPGFDLDEPVEPVDGECLELPDIERTEEPDEYPPTTIVPGFDLDEPSKPTE